MKYLLFISVLLLPPLPIAKADANEEEFTVKVEHYEIPGSRSFDGANFKGRAWDLQNVLNAARFPTGLQWLHAGNERGSQAQGNTYCVRVGALPEAEGRAPAIAPEQREQTLVNLLVQLEQRKAEMKVAGAYYRVEYPSRCASEKPRRLAKLDRKSSRRVR